MITSQQAEVIKRCKKSVIWFMQNFVKIKHPGAGIVPFNPFDYQQHAIRCFRKHRMNIFRKTRQCFVGESLVDTEHGQRRIDQIVPGERVWSLSHVSNQPILVPVKEVYVNPGADLWEVDAHGHNAIPTADHLYLTQRGEVEVQHLTKDDKLIGFDNGELRERAVYGAWAIGERADKLYDLRIPPFDNYSVDGAFVHNCGISKVSGIFALWFAMFAPHKTILIVSRKDDDAMSFLAENIKLPFSYLPEWMRQLWKPIKDNEHELVFPNGSKIKSLTSHPDVLRSNASSLNIIDEAAFINDMDAMWAAGRPTLQHGGSVIVISTCVVGGTYIMTEDGLGQIGEFDGGYTGYNDGYHHKDYNGPAIYGRSALQMPTTFYKRGIKETRRIISKLGYELEADTKHMLWICREGEEAGWAFADEVQPGDFIPIKRGMMQFGNADTMNFSDGPDKHHKSSFVVESIDEELAGIIGLIIAEGYINGDYVTITNGDKEVHEFLLNNGWGLLWSPEERETHIRCCNRRFVRFLRWLGCKPGLAPDKVIPRRLWSCSRPIIASFLRRLFDGDGHSRTRNGEVGYTSTSRELIKQVRMMLLNFGIICREEYHPAYEKEFNLNSRRYVSQCRESWQLLICSGEAPKFYDLIGFALDRKTENSHKTGDRYEYVPNVRYWLQRLRQESGLSIGELKRRGVNAPSLLFKKRKRDLTKRSVLNHLINVLGDHSEYSSFKALESLTDESIYWDEVKFIEVSEAETYDFTIPGDHTFWSSGLISHNTNGQGNWYWNTWTDAEGKANDFNPLIVHWWDMKWSIEYRDALSNQLVRIAPTEGILATAKGTYGVHPRFGRIELIPEKYGPFWSPWLEEQYRDLQEKGEIWKFEQEILAAFVGSGNTVIPKSVLVHVGNTINDNFEVVTGIQTYVHPVTGESEQIDYTPNEPHEGLLIWRKPVTATPDKTMGGRVVALGRKAHVYVAGVDTATGRGRDWNAIEVFDVDTLEQVAEAMFHCLPSTFKKMIDHLCRWYNCALTNIERNNGGDMIINDINTDYNYPRLWRRSEFNGKSVVVGQYGFFTSSASKAAINKVLLDYIRDVDGQGFRIYSRRLLKQMQIYVRKRDKAGRDTGKTEAESGVGNFDDLVMASGLGLITVPDSYGLDAAGHMPYTANELSSLPANHVVLQANMKKILDSGAVLMPMTFGGSDPEQTAQEELLKFASQMGGLPTIVAQRENMAAVHKKKYQF